MKRKLLLSSILLLLFNIILTAQFFDIDASRNLPAGARGDGGGTEELNWLNESRFGFNANDLSLQGTSEVLKYNIGEKDKFYIPLYLLITITGEGLDETSDKQLTFNNLLNPIGGVFNALLSKSFKVIPFKTPAAGENRARTTFSIVTGGGYKLLSGKGIVRDSVASNISTLYGDLGLRFITGAWVSDDESKEGTFGIQAKIFGTTALGEDAALDEVFGLNSQNSFLGFSSDLILFITDEIDLRLNLSLPLSIDRINDELQRSLINFTVNYSGNK